MKVNCLTVGDFTENLIKVGSPVEVFQKSVWVQTTYRGIDHSDLKQAAKHQVFFQAAAVVTTDDGEYILCLGIDCGIDYHDTTQDFVASEYMNEQKEELQKFCDAQGLKVLPGTLDM